MPFEYLTDTPLMGRLLANDPPSQITLTRKLSRLNRKVMELLVKQPDFEAFVPSEFDRTDRIGPPFQDALKAGDRPSLRALMVEVLTRDGYQIDFSYPMPGELLFRRPASQTLYWLQLQRTSAGVVSRSEVNAPSPFLMSTLLHARVGAAQGSNNLVSLMGGINRSLDGATSIFVIRI